MNTFKILICALTIVIGFSTTMIYAADTSGSASVDVMSNYLWRGQKLSEGVAIQPAVGISYGGFGVNIWANYDSTPNEHTETDLTLNYTFSLDKFGFDVGYVYYALEGFDDTQEFYLGVSYDTLLSPSATLYKDSDDRKVTGKSTGGVEYEVKFLPKVKVGVAVPEEKCDEVLKVIQDQAKTGEFGDGKIFVYNLEDVIRIRTGERGKEAL